MHYRPEVTGILLRYALLDVMHGVAQPASIDEIVRAIEGLGVEIPARKGKWVSDALRTEHKKGRIIRVGRNRYVGTEIPRSTRYRAKRSIRDHRAPVEGTFRDAAG
ncbi:MAG: hypothetical protein DHS20C19_15410 [Acidimicrobiales bacterium]|nr:MAG: hypothetical protein DHS20C19_15410 [Acidimicrobiales bacterium]